MKYSSRLANGFASMAVWRAAVNVCRWVKSLSVNVGDVCFLELFFTVPPRCQSEKRSTGTPRRPDRGQTAGGERARRVRGGSLDPGPSSDEPDVLPDPSEPPPPEERLLTAEERRARMPLRPGLRLTERRKTGGLTTFSNLD